MLKFKTLLCRVLPIAALVLAVAPSMTLAADPSPPQAPPQAQPQWQTETQTQTSTPPPSQTPLYPQTPPQSPTPTLSQPQTSTPPQPQPQTSTPPQTQSQAPSQPQTPLSPQTQSQAPSQPQTPLYPQTQNQAPSQPHSPTETLGANHPERWTAYGYNIIAPAAMWPMLELLHTQHFDWELSSASQRPTPLEWDRLPVGSYGQYLRSINVVKLSTILQNESVEVAAAFLAHELTHLNDDLNARLGDMTGDLCYEAETRAFVNEANFWQMVNGPLGKTTQDAIELKENAKMFAFVGNPGFADLVVRTTASYVAQCGPDRAH